MPPPLLIFWGDLSQTLNSSFNVVIYGVFSEKFRDTFCEELTHYFRNAQTSTWKTHANNCSDIQFNQRSDWQSCKKLSWSHIPNPSPNQHTPTHEICKIRNPKQTPSQKSKLDTLLYHSKPYSNWNSNKVYFFTSRECWKVTRQLPTAERYVFQSECLSLLALISGSNTFFSSASKLSSMYSNEHNSTRSSSGSSFTSRSINISKMTVSVCSFSDRMFEIKQRSTSSNELPEHSHSMNEINANKNVTKQFARLNLNFVSCCTLH